MCITMTYLTNKLNNGDNSYQCWGIYTETHLKNFRQYFWEINLIFFSLILTDLQHGRKFRLDKIITGSEIRNFQLVFVYFSTKCSYCEEQKWKVEHIRDIAGPNTRRGFISKSTIIYYDYFLFLQLHSFYLGSPLVKLCVRDTILNQNSVTDFIYLCIF